MANLIVVAAEMVGAAVVQEVVSRTVSLVLGKRKKASQGQYLERLTKAVHDVEFMLERTAKLPITEVTLLGDRSELKRDFIQAACQLSSRYNHKKRKESQAQPQEISQQAVVVTTTRSSSHGNLVITTRPPIMSPVSSFIGDMMSKDGELCLLSCDDVERFEQFADSARNILRKVESGCSLRRYMFFPCPLVRHLLEGKDLRYERTEGSKWLGFGIWPVVLEGRGVEAWLWYACFDPERLDKSFSLRLAMRLSESTDIVGTAIECVRSTTLLNDLGDQDAVKAELTQLLNLQDISDSYAPPPVGFGKSYAMMSRRWRSDPVCCQANGHEPTSVERNIPSELSRTFPEETIYFSFSCYIPALEYSLPGASRTAAGRNNAMTDRPPLKLQVTFVPHSSLFWDYVIETMESKIERRPFGSIQQTADMIRSRYADCLIHQSEMTWYAVLWFSTHGCALFRVEKPSTAEVVYFYFEFFVSAPKYSLRSSLADVAGKRSVMRDRRPPLKMIVKLMPHSDHNVAEYIDVSMGQVGETVRSRAVNCFFRQPKVRKYGICWFTKHGAVGFYVDKGERRIKQASSPEQVQK